MFFILMGIPSTVQSQFIAFSPLAPFARRKK